MRFRMHITSVKDLVSRGTGPISTGIAMRGLAIGALLIAGTGTYFGMVDGLEGNPASSDSAALREWQRSYLPGIDRLDDQIAAELAAGYQEYHRRFLADQAEGKTNAVSTEREAVLEWQRS